MSRIQSRLMQLDAQELTLTEEREQIQRLLDDPSRIATSLGPTRSPEEQSLITLRRELAQKRAVFSDQHPQVRALLAEIAALEGIITGQAPGDESSGGGQVSELQASLAQIDANLAFLDRQRTQLEQQLEDIKSSIELTPDVEMSLNILNRDWAALQSRYQAELEKLNTAAAGEAIEVRQQGVRFEVIEQARIPDEPVSPNRLLIALGSIVGGVIAGLGLIVLLEVLNRSVRRPVDISKGLGIEPFAVVPYISTRREVIAQRLRLGLGLAAAAGGIPLILFIIHHQVMPIDLIMSKMMTRFGLGHLMSSLG